MAAFVHMPPLMEMTEITAFEKQLAGRPASELLSLIENIDKAQYPEHHEAVRRHILAARGATPATGDGRFFNGYEIVAKIEEKARKRFNPLYLLFFSAAAFMLAGGMNASWLSVSLLAVVVLIHELGHLAAMRVFHYRNTNIFFLPFIGGLATGTPPQPNSTKEAIVSLMGPLIGFLSGVVFLIIAHTTASAVWLELARLSLAINLFNLLPLFPLDGGQILQSVFFNRYFIAEVVFKALGALALAYFAFEFKDIFLGVLAYVLMIQIRVLFMEKKILDHLRPEQDAFAGELTPATAGRIHSSLLQFEDIANKPFYKLGAVANRVAGIHRKLQKDTSSVAVGSGVVIFQVVFFLVGFVVFGFYFGGK